MTTSIHRRGFLGTAAAAALSQPLLGTPAFADYAVAPAKRRAASTLAATDPIVVGYARAVAAMKALPSTDPCSWTAQAAIHWPSFGPAGPCDHGSWFWSWHRMYLHFFERIIRHKSGMYDWALPYWDYDWETTASSALQRQIPAPLRNTASTLYDGTRNSALNTGASLSLGATATAAGFSLTGYASAQSSFEGTPHDVVHTSVCGNMCSFPTAGLDPLFWMHHCNIDRLWNLWLAKGGGRSSPVNDATWRGKVFTFYDECCNPVTMTPCDVLRAAQQLSYVYEVEPPQVNQYCRTIIRWPDWEINVIARLKLPEPVILGPDESSVPLVGTDKALGERLVALAKDPSASLVMRFTDVMAARQPGASWEVYVGQRGQVKTVPESPNFVGNVALFGDGIEGEGHHAAEFSFALDRALGDVSDPSQLDIVFVPSSGVVVDGRPVPPKVEAPVRIGEISVQVERPRK
jgi:tyrosinase